MNKKIIIIFLMLVVVFFLIIEYYQGEDYIKKTEIIDFNDVGADILETKETEKNGSLETEEFESEEAISYDYASIYEKAINYAIPVLREEGYEILCENICVNPKSVYEDSWLVEQLEDILDSCRDWESAATDYFLFDLNDDGIDEYIVSIYSSIPSSFKSKRK